MKSMRVLLSLLALAATALADGHAGEYYLVDKMCWDNGSDPAGNDLSTLAGVQAHSKTCLDMCVAGEPGNLVLVRDLGASEDPRLEVAYEIDGADVGDATNPTIVAVTAMLDASLCNNDFEVVIAAGTVTAAQGDGNQFWDVGSDGTIAEHDACAVQEGTYYVVDQMCWGNEADPAGNDLTTVEGLTAHTAECALMDPCQNSGYVLVQMVDGVATEMYEVGNGSCSDVQHATHGACTGNDTWTFSQDQQDIVGALTQYMTDGCTNNLMVSVQNVDDTTAVAAGVVTGASYTMTCADNGDPAGTDTDNTPEEESSAAVASLAGLLAGALLL